ncbi:MAG: hypothetical protein JXB49_04815 [Bacteroidales bacterium]|nr:hypothetical protein [Bacteroidales bacterium]
MKTLHYSDILVEIVNDELFDIDSSDNNFNYDFVYRDTESSEYKPSSKHGVILKKNETTIKSAILCAVGGATGIQDTSAIVDDDKLLICVSNKIFCLSLPVLELDWIINPDWATCFQIFKTNYGYLIHGETEISMIDKLGKIIWSFGGADIFVDPDGNDVIELNEKYINLIDWTGQKYKIDYKGKEIK